MSQLGRIDTVTVRNEDGTTYEVRLRVIGIAEPAATPEPQPAPEPAPEVTPEP